MKYLFIINPQAGSGRALKTREPIRDYMDSRGLDYEIHISKKPKEAIDLVVARQNEFNVFVAVGGDGTINEVAQGLARSGKGILAIIPRGTANDLAKSLGLEKDLKASLDKIVEARTRRLDIVKVQDSYAFNVACLGLDAQAIVNYNRMKFFGSRLDYLVAVLYTIFNFDYRDLEIYLDGKKISRSISLMAMGNGSHYGNFFKIMPDARPDNGLINVCIIKKLARWKIFFLAPLLVLGWHGLVKKQVEFYECEEILILSKKSLYLNLDGEIIENSGFAQFEINGYLKTIY